MIDSYMIDSYMIDSYMIARWRKLLWPPFLLDENIELALFMHRYSNVVTQ